LNQQATTNPDVHVLEQLLAVGRRRWFAVVAFALLGAVLGFGYAISQVPTYASSATIMVRSGPAVDPLRQGIQTSTPEEEGQFLSQLELVRSSSVAQTVANQLGLAEDAAFAARGTSRLERLVSRVIGKKDRKAEALADDQVVARLQRDVRVLRVGRTYVAAISYSHNDPAVAQKVAQAFADAFKQKMAQENDVANSRLRAALQSEIDRATSPEKEALQARLRDIMISRSLPGMDVIVLNNARLPGAPVAPRTSFLVAVGLILGAVIGCALAGFRELTDRGVRDGDALARYTGTRFLGYLPRRSPRLGANTTIGNGQPLPDAARRVVLEPHSVFGETVRAMGVAILSSAEEGKSQITGLTSVLPGEGTSVLSVNLAAHLASIGRSVLLVDVDSREARLSKWLASGAEQGIVDALLQDKPIDDCVLYDSKTNLSLMPMTIGDGRIVEPSALFSSARAQAFFEKLTAQYQHVILDLSPLSVAADARAATRFADGFVLAAQWGKATPQLVADLLDAEPEVRAKLLGLVLTRADLRKLPLYAAAGSRGSFQRRIARG
jgi:Mrp family chromosome partitioning ATPase/capsular polysaccharide biosynthesis protein